MSSAGTATQNLWYSDTSGKVSDCSAFELRQQGQLTSVRLHQAQHHQGTPEESISYVTEKPSQSAEGDSNMHDTPKACDFSHAYNMRERGKSRPLNAWLLWQPLWHSMQSLATEQIAPVLRSVFVCKPVATYEKPASSWCYAASSCRVTGSQCEDTLSLADRWGFWDCVFLRAKPQQIWPEYVQRMSVREPAAPLS